MEIDYKDKKDKYYEKIEKLESSINFTPETVTKVINLINHWDFLKEVLTINDVKRGCSLNNELQIRIKIGDKIYIFVPNYRTLVTSNDISMILELMNLENRLQKNETMFDLSNDAKYKGIINNAVILGYIFLMRMNRKIKFKDIKHLNPIAKKIVEMVFDINKVAIPKEVEESKEVDDEVDKC